MYLWPRSAVVDSEEMVEVGAGATAAAVGSQAPLEAAAEEDSAVGAAEAEGADAVEMGAAGAGRVADGGVTEAQEVTAEVRCLGMEESSWRLAAAVMLAGSAVVCLLGETRKHQYSVICYAAHAVTEHTWC